MTPFDIVGIPVVTFALVIIVGSIRDAVQDHERKIAEAKTNESRQRAAQRHSPPSPPPPSDPADAEPEEETS